MWISPAFTAASSQQEEDDEEEEIEEQNHAYAVQKLGLMGRTTLSVFLDKTDKSVKMHKV